MFPTHHDHDSTVVTLPGVGDVTVFYGTDDGAVVVEINGCAGKNVRVWVNDDLTVEDTIPTT